MAVDYTFSPNDIYVAPISTQVVESVFPSDHEVDEYEDGEINRIGLQEEAYDWSYEDQYIVIQAGSSAEGEGGGGGPVRPSSGFIYPRGI